MMLECTVNKEVAVSDKKKQLVPVEILVNEDHIRAIQPRIEGGSIITFADQTATIVAESMSDIKKQLNIIQKKVTALEAPNDAE